MTNSPDPSNVIGTIIIVLFFLLFLGFMGWAIFYPDTWGPWFQGSSSWRPWPQKGWLLVPKDSKVVVLTPSADGVVKSDDAEMSPESDSKTSAMFGQLPSLVRVP